jgi:fructokinase
MNVLCFGEILFDIIEGKAYPGGAPLNFAAHTARLGAHAYMMSRIGKDTLGEKALNHMQKWGIDTRFVQIDSTHQTGRVDVTLNNGQPSYTIHENVAFDYIDWEDSISSNTPFTFLYMGTLAQRNSESHSTLRKLIEKVEFQHVFYDINLRQKYFNREVIHESLLHTTIFKINDEEVEVITELLFGRQMTVEEFCVAVAEKYTIRTIVITLGADGCYLYSKKKLTKVPGIKVVVKDTVGAGDAFSAAFMFYYIATKDPMIAIQKANLLGSYVASCRGAVPEYSSDLIKTLKA